MRNDLGIAKRQRRLISFALMSLSVSVVVTHGAVEYTVTGVMTVEDRRLLAPSGSGFVMTNESTKYNFLVAVRGCDWYVGFGTNEIDNVWAYDGTNVYHRWSGFLATTGTNGVQAALFKATLPPRGAIPHTAVLWTVLASSCYMKLDHPKGLDVLYSDSKPEFMSANLRLAQTSPNLPLEIDYMNNGADWPYPYSGGFTDAVITASNFASLSNGCNLPMSFTFVQYFVGDDTNRVRLDEGTIVRGNVVRAEPECAVQSFVPDLPNEPIRAFDYRLIQSKQLQPVTYELTNVWLSEEQARHTRQYMTIVGPHPKTGSRRLILICLFVLISVPFSVALWRARLRSGDDAIESKPKQRTREKQ